MKETMKKRKILWVDDEIHLLKPHILFLQEKGFEMITATNGVDALEIIKKEYIAAALLDEMMPGLDGLTVLEKIRDFRPDMPVIMITKNEEESLMEDAIGKQISDYLTKPINPSQVLLSLKKNLDSADFTRDVQAQEFLSFYGEFNNKINMGVDLLSEWCQIHDRLSYWNIEFAKNSQYDLEHFLTEITETANREFQRYILREYPGWMNKVPDVPLSPSVMEKFVRPSLEKGEKVLFVLIDCLRYDQWLAIAPLFYDQFRIQLNRHVSILPTATPYSRNAIFAGMFPDSIDIEYPDLYPNADSDESMNRYESKLLEDYLRKSKLHLKNGFSYFKVFDSKYGDQLVNKFSDLQNKDLLVLVANFVDILAHKRSVSDVLLEIVPDEAGYRNVVKNWIEGAYLKRIITLAGEAGYKVVITSDHGSRLVKRGTLVKADKDSTNSLRYKVGRNLVVSGKTALHVKNPQDFRLPKTQLNQNFIFARDDYFFLYPNNIKIYEKKYPGTFQHGGISMDEMILPVAILEPGQ